MSEKVSGRVEITPPIYSMKKHSRYYTGSVVYPLYLKLFNNRLGFLLTIVNYHHSNSAGFLSPYKIHAIDSAIAVNRRSHEKQGIDAVEYPAVAGYQVA